MPESRKLLKKVMEEMPTNRSRRNKRGVRKFYKYIIIIESLMDT